MSIRRSPQRQPLRDIGGVRRDVDIHERVGALPAPAGPAAVRGPAGQLETAGRLVVPGPQPGRRSDVDAVQAVLGVAVEQVTGRTGGPEGLAELREPPPRRRRSPVLAAASSQAPTDASEPTRSAASSAGPASRAAASAAATSAGMASGSTRVRLTTPADAPSIAMTVTDLLIVMPLVVRVLPAKRRLALLDSVHQDDAAAGRRRRQGPLDGLLRGQRLDHRPASVRVFRTLTASEQRRRATVADRGHLTRLTLAAVHRASEHPGLRSADRFQRAPEVRRRRLVGDVPQLPGELPVPDQEEPLTGELEVVALHVDRPAVVADDVDAALDPADQLGSCDGPSAAGCSDTLAIRWIGTCPGESAKAQPLERSSPCRAAIRRSS